MDEWRKNLFGQIVPEAQRPTTQHSAATGHRADAFGAATALEIAFGIARSEIAYVLEVARAHKQPAQGNVNGDDVWMQLGGARLRFHYDRKAGTITATVPGRDEANVAHDGAKLVLGGAEFDARTFVRSAIDATVAAWKSPQEQPKKTEG